MRFFSAGLPSQSEQFFLIDFQYGLDAAKCRPTVYSREKEKYRE